MKPIRIFFVLASVGFIAGCASDNPQQSDAARRQDAALANPGGYKLEVPADLGNGDLLHFGSGLGRDTNDALNP